MNPALTLPPGSRLGPAYATPQGCPRITRHSHGVPAGHACTP
ncbi:Hypothetical protein CAP_8798 [Chondromyces apiculatus DSM 436]|uniref:Uncharacterized protein n=1 Tax=Chondromyces apiculatus DSM 436 TaxID=1192034 RepID=A0A017SXJ5_9BACT|nr:Hypothetical protein CAP_8798 [Chondromyces apiculatus DSM 436]